jgi:hypothetical protein
MRARHLQGGPLVVYRRQVIERDYLPSARDLFPVLRERLLASRPVIGVGWPNADPIYGSPTFRNRIDENGQWI